jgi:hypothetical protein
VLLSDHLMAGFKRQDVRLRVGKLAEISLLFKALLSMGTPRVHGLDLDQSSVVLGLRTRDLLMGVDTVLVVTTYCRHAVRPYRSRETGRRTPNIVRPHTCQYRGVDRCTIEHVEAWNLIRSHRPHYLLHVAGCEPATRIAQRTFMTFQYLRLNLQ